MPYLRLYCPELPVKQKKLIAKELTEATTRLFKLSNNFTNRCTVQFMPFRMEDIAIGGELLSERGEPDYHLEVFYRNLTEDQKQGFVQEVTPSLVRLLNLNPRSWLARLLRITDPPLFRISILFNQYEDENFAVGGRFITELEPHDAGSAKSPENGTRELAAAKAAENGY